MKPEAKLDFDTPKRGLIYLANNTLEFEGKYKSYGGNLISTVVSQLMSIASGEVTFYLPLVLIKSIQLKEVELKIIFWKVKSALIEIIYTPEGGSAELRKLMFYPDFNPNFKDPTQIYVDKDLEPIYNSSIGAVYNWKNILDWQLQNLPG